MTLNRYRLRNLAKNGHRGAMKAAALLKSPERLIGLILLGNNFVNILASALATLLAINLWGDRGIAIATGALTLVILIFAEVLPKTLATLKSENLAFFAAHIYTPLLKVTWPLVFLVNSIVNKLLVFAGVDTRQNSNADTSLRVSVSRMRMVRQRIFAPS